MTSGRAAGLVLAAGSGSRMGRPKALVRDADGTPWLDRAVRVLREGGADSVTVVLGASADEARALVPAGVVVTVATDWEVGQSASLRTGLHALRDDVDAAVLTLVDLPDLTADVVRRVLAAGTGPQALSRAVYHGRPGHPVVLGRDHWGGVLDTSAGDEGARSYLAGSSDGRARRVRRPGHRPRPGHGVRIGAEVLNDVAESGSDRPSRARFPDFCQ